MGVFIFKDIWELRKVGLRNGWKEDVMEVMSEKLMEHEQLNSMLVLTAIDWTDHFHRWYFEWPNKWMAAKV